MKLIRTGGYIVIGCVALLVILTGLLVMNGLWLANNEIPVMVRTSYWKDNDTDISGLNVKKSKFWRIISPKVLSTKAVRDLRRGKKC